MPDVIRHPDQFWIAAFAAMMTHSKPQGINPQQFKNSCDNYHMVIFHFLLHPVDAFFLKSLID
jgi:hypothetical protein